MERELQLVLEASRCGMNAGGFPLPWWPRGIKHQVLALNFVLDDWSTTTRLGPEEQEARGPMSPFERRHGEAFTGLLLPLGAAV